MHHLIGANVDQKTLIIDSRCQWHFFDTVTYFKLTTESDATKCSTSEPTDQME
jgi:hypothetical protein